MFFFGNDSNINLRINKPEFSEWKWIEPSELEGITVNFKKSIYRKILSEFANKLTKFR